MNRSNDFSVVVRKKEWKTVPSVKMERVHMQKAEFVMTLNTIVKLNIWI